MLRIFKKPKKRRVVLHHATMNESLEGVWDGTVVSGHYPLEFPQLLTNAGAKVLPGSVLVPGANVTFIQVLEEDAR